MADLLGRGQVNNWSGITPNRKACGPKTIYNRLLFRVREGVYRAFGRMVCVRELYGDNTRDR